MKKAKRKKINVRKEVQKVNRIVQAAEALMEAIFIPAVMMYFLGEKMLQNKLWFLIGGFIMLTCIFDGFQEVCEILDPPTRKFDDEDEY